MITARLIDQDWKWIQIVNFTVFKDVSEDKAKTSQILQCKLDVAGIYREDDDEYVQYRWYASQ